MLNAKKYSCGFLGGQLFLVISIPLSYAQEKKDLVAFLRQL